jgi:hypothetical protein
MTYIAIYYPMSAEQPDINNPEEVIAVSDDKAYLIARIKSLAAKDEFDFTRNVTMRDGAVAVQGAYDTDNDDDFQTYYIVKEAPSS